MAESNGNGHQFRIEGTQLRVMLRGMAREVGAVNKLAVKLGITGQYLDCILNGKKQPGPKVLKAMNLRKVVVYEPIIDINEDNQS